MKHYLLALLLCLSSFLSFSQNGINQIFKGINFNEAHAKAVSPFSIKTTNALTSSLFNEGFTPITLEVSQKIVDEIKPSTNLLKMSVPLSLTDNIELELYAVNIFSPDFKVFNSQKREIPHPKGQFFHGRIKGDTNSIAAMSILNGEISAIISDATGNRTLKKQNKAGNYLLYYEHNLKEKSELTCVTNDDTPAPPMPNGPITSGMTDCKVVKISLEVDYDIYEKSDYNSEIASNYAVGLFNQVALLYRQNVIALQISSLLIWDTPDPYIDPTNSLTTVLNKFKTIRGTDFNGNITLLFSSRRLGGGIANGFLGLCDKSTAHSVCGNLREYSPVPTFSSSVQIIAHELGHNFGSKHTHACVWNGNNTAIDGCWSVEGGCPTPAKPAEGGTIMSYCHLSPNIGIAFNLGFGPQPGTLIRNNVSVCNLLETNATLPDNLTSSNIGFTSAVVSWRIPITSTYFTVRYSKAGANAWQYEFVLSSTSFTINNLLRGVEYEWQVTGDCSNNVYSQSAYFTTLSNASISTSSIATNLCESGKVNIGFVVSGTLNNGNVFTAQLSESNGSFSNPVNIGTLSGLQSSTISATIPAGITAGNGYRIRVVSSSPVAIGTDNGANVTINTIPDAPIALTGSSCGEGVVTLGASGCNGTINWYNLLTGTTLIATGSTYTTPIINTDTDYFADCTVGTCVSNRTTVKASINPLPAAPIAPSVSRCGPGTLTLVASGCSGGTIGWYTTPTSTTALITGGTFVSPNLGTTTDYYAACTIGACTSSVTTVSAIVNINAIFANPSQPSGIYRASQTITSTSNTAGPTYYYAGASIMLSPGFQVGAGDVFSAIIQNCQ